MLENRNTILAVILSGLVLIAWQYFYNIPQMERQRAEQAQAELQKKSAAAQQPATGASPSTAPQAGSGQAPQAGSAPASAPPAAANAPAVDRNTALGSDARVKVETPSVIGSIRLKGARIDDLSLVKFRETVDPNSPPIVIYAPSNTAEP
jgi:YidC/Oxa1 family membrane protein insertase